MIALDPKSSPPPTYSFTQRVGPPFDLDNADLILRTEDSRDFTVYKQDIMRTSMVLATKLKKSEAGTPGPMVYDVKESYMVWWIILWHLYGDDRPAHEGLFCSIEHVYRAYNLSMQLEMHPIAAKIRSILDTLTQQRPFEAFHIFFLTHETNWLMHCELAARHTLHTSDTFARDFLSGEENAMLEHFWGKCADAAVEALLNTTRPNHNYCWQRCGRCPTEWCINQDKWPSGWTKPEYQGSPVASWFASYLHETCHTLHRIPSSIVVDDFELAMQCLLDSDSEVCMTCQTCRIYGLKDLIRFNRRAKTLIEQAISKVPLVELDKDGDELVEPCSYPPTPPEPTNGITWD